MTMNSLQRFRLENDALFATLVNLLRETIQSDELLGSAAFSISDIEDALIVAQEIVWHERNLAAMRRRPAPMKCDKELASDKREGVVP